MVRVGEDFEKIVSKFQGCYSPPWQVTRVSVVLDLSF